MNKSNNDFNFRVRSNRSLFIAGGTDFFFGRGGNGGGGGSLEYYRASGGEILL